MSEEKLYKQTMKEIEECEANLNEMEKMLEESTKQKINETSKIFDNYSNNLNKIYQETDAYFENKTRKYR